MTACSPAGNEVTDVKIFNLVGLWNSSEKGGSKVDVMYTRISSNGDIIEYDFDGDEIDQGLQCYQVNIGNMRHIDASRYQIIIDIQDNKVFEVDLEVLDAGHALQVSFIGSKDSENVEHQQEIAKSQMLDEGKRFSTSG